MSTTTETAAEDRFVRAMVEWLNRTLAPDGVVIQPDTALFQDRLIDSIAILRLIAWTEREIGARIPDTQIRMDNFHSVQRIAAVFAKGGINVGC